MTIYAYTGLPGSGKTLHATRTVLRRVWRRHPLPAVTTWQLRLADAPPEARRCWHCVPADQLTPALLTAAAEDYWRTRGPAREDRLLLAIDEAHIIYGARQWARKDRQEWLAWYGQHRHQGWTVLLLVQSLKMLDSQLRSIVDEERRHINLARWLPSPLPIIWDIGSSPTVGVGTYRQIIIPWPRIMRAYDTMASVDTVVADKGASHGKE